MAQQRELSETSIKGCLEPERLPGYILAPSCATPTPKWCRPWIQVTVLGEPGSKRQLPLLESWKDEGGDQSWRSNARGAHHNLPPQPAPSAAAALSWLRREKAQSSATARTRRQWVPAELSTALSKLRVKAATVP